MGSRGIGLTDVHWIVKIMYEDPELVLNRDRLGLALGISMSHLTDIQRAVGLYMLNTFGFLTMTLNMWISLDAAEATTTKLVHVLRESNFNSVADEITIKLEEMSRIENLSRQGSSPERGPVWFEVPTATNSFSVHRTQEIEKLHSSIMSQNLEDGPTEITVLQGLMDGVGKRTLAVHYATEHSTRSQFYFNVIWIQGLSKSTITHSFRQLARRLKICETVVDSYKIMSAIYEYFGSTMTLIVFDNVVSYADVAQFLPNRSSSTLRPFVLILSQGSVEWNLRTEVIYLDGFKTSESVQFFQGILFVETDDHVKLVTEITSILQNFPLALSIAGAYLKMECGKSNQTKEQVLESYLILLKKESNQFRVEKVSNPCEIAVCLTYKITMEKLHKRTSLTKKIMEIISYFSFRDPIPIKLLGDVQKVSLGTVESGVEILSAYSLVTRLSSSSISVHALLQLVVRNDVEKRRGNSILEKVAHSFKTPLTSQHFSFKEDDLCLVHSKVISEHMRRVRYYKIDIFEKLRVQRIDKYIVATTQLLESFLKNDNMNVQEMEEFYERGRKIFAVDSYGAKKGLAELLAMQVTNLICGKIKMIWQRNSPGFEGQVLLLIGMCKRVLGDIEVSLRVWNWTADLQEFSTCAQLSVSASGLCLVAKHTNGSGIKNDCLHLASRIYTILYFYSRMKGNEFDIARYWQSVLDCQATIQRYSGFNIELEQRLH